MADRYWVGNSGLWSDSAHWSTSSGGAGGASIPTSADHVYFNANSFTLAGQTVTVDAAALNCNDMNWTGALNNPTLHIDKAVAQIGIYGNLTLIANMVLYNHQSTATIYLKSTATGKQVNLNGISIPAGLGFGFNGAGGEWTLLSDVNCNQFILVTGSLNTNSKNITCYNFSSTGSSLRSLTLGNSSITCSSSLGFELVNNNLTFDCGTSLIKMNGDNSSFKGGDCTYYNVELNGTPMTVTGSNTFNDLKLSAGKIYSFTAGTTQAINSLSGEGTSGSLITIKSATDGTLFTISKTVGSITATYYSIKDCTATGGAMFYAIGSTNAGGNTGWSWTTVKEILFRISATMNAAKQANKYLNFAVKSLLSLTKTWRGTVFPKLELETYDVTMEVVGMPYAGSTVTLKGTFPNKAGNLMELEDVSLKIYSQGRSLIQTIVPTEIQTGVYSADYTIPATTLGQLDYEFSGVLGGKTIVGRSSFDSIWK